MRFLFYIACAVVISMGLLSGCSRVEKAESSQQAIETSKSLATAQEKVDYLLQQAQAFQSSKQFQEVINVTQYILRYVDAESQMATNLLENAKAKLTGAVESAASDISKKIGSFGQ